ncbi:ABC transporter ATP-binding protein [Capsulimonas corticalis]|uniref:ABC transporter ATP-binding protein n=1 Tax=Capsulimonas corticalis TaxID=2219043 RepID=A0A402CYU2_9BACT|nr:ATP-binding cassette domain-containing protein [Capsulimonas corticalis]BDI29649.1 ABC transporter ATP-binding protein [Capsulimonas corticalis]
MPPSTQSTHALLQIQGLAIAAGDVPLQTNLHLDLAPGELLAITGPSGCGKTTLLRTVTALQPALAGTIRLQGRTPEEWGWAAFRRKATLVTQRPTLLDLTVEENLRRPFHYRTAATPYPEQRARDLMEELAVGADRLTQAARTLSIGQQQRVCLIRALLMDPPVLCLDEPTSALDPDAVGLVERLIRRLAQDDGLAALVVTHDPRLAAEWCTRQFLMPRAEATV